MIRVLHFVAKMDRAGQETFLMNLFRKTDAKEFQFNFLCTDPEEGAYDKEIYALGGHVYHTDPLTIKGPLKQLQSVKVLYKALKAHPCDVFHIHTHHALDAFLDALTAKCSGVKTVVVHSHNTSALYHLKAHAVCKRLLCLLPIKRFACSEAAGHWMFCGNHFQVIHNGLDLDVCHFDPEQRNQVRSQMGWEGKKIVGHVGRFNEQKNHRFLIDVFEKMHQLDPDTHLVLVGKGELEEEIRAKVTAKGLDEAVSFLGVRTDVIQLYQGMDMLLFPSLFEGLSVVLTEAQACDLPCLVSDTNSKETILSDRLTMWPLEASAENWAEEAQKVLSSSISRGDNRDQIRAAGYDISQLARDLKKRYFEK